MAFFLKKKIQLFYQVQYHRITEKKKEKCLVYFPFSLLKKLLRLNKTMKQAP